MFSAQKILQWKHTKEGVAALLALLLYLMGVKFLLLPIVILLNARYMPMPSVFRSWFARLFGGALWMVVLLQVAATIQFFVWPASNFQFLAALIVLVHVFIWRFVPVREQRQRKLFDMADVGATIVGVVFLLPFVILLLGNGITNGIAQVGGIQAIDATNHYAGTGVMTDLQHLDYEPESYYPKGFHISEAFVESTVVGSRDDLGWQGNAILFLAQYLVMGLAMAYATYYFALSLLGVLNYKLAGFGPYFLLAACLAPCLVIFYLLAFVNEGFLNYYYVIVSVLFGFAYLVDLGMCGQGSDDWRRVFMDKTLRWMVVSSLLMVYAVSMSWTLLMPPLILSALLFATPLGLNIIAMAKMLFTKQGLPILLMIFIQLIPVYFQLRYSAPDAGGITATGGFKAYHPFVLLFGVGVMIAFVWCKNVLHNFKTTIVNLYLPVLVFAMLLVAALYFATGEVRYYAIKTSVLFEVLTLVLAVVGLLYINSRSGLQGLKYVWMLPIIPLVVMLLLVNTTDSPLKGVRDLFRTYSHAPKPEFYDHDLQVYANLGNGGQIKHFNSTLLHYNKNGNGKLYAHMQIPFWSNMMMLGTGQPNYDAMYCNRDLYSNIGFGNFTDAEQEALKLKVRKCAEKAHERGLQYYIVTDKGSAEIIRGLFGDVAQVVY